MRLWLAASFGMFGRIRAAKPGVGRLLHSIARRLVLRDQEEVDRAGTLARENGLVELEGLHSVRLTAAGRALFKSNDKR
jgi:hypothetical protein